MSKVKAWVMQHGPDITGFFGIGLMALGVGMQYNATGAIAVFALGLPILEIKRHMREHLQLNLMVLHALRDVSVAMQEQRVGERLTVEAVRDLHVLLKRVADEGVTRD